ncbi:MAG: hypothetical protein ACRES1_01500 [Steroidobacteraceae bacterium]
MTDAESTPAGEEPVPLNLVPKQALRRRARSVAVAAVIVGVAFGGIVGLFAGRWPGLLVALAIAVPLVLLALSESRRRTWLDGHIVVARAMGTRRVDLHRAERVDLLVTQARGTRTVGLLVVGAPEHKTINIAVASYSGVGGAELDILALRKLADALAGAQDTRGLVFSELLVAVLRSEARGDGLEDRPLYRLVSMVGERGLARKVHADAVSKFVTTLD